MWRVKRSFTRPKHRRNARRLFLLTMMAKGSPTFFEPSAPQHTIRSLGFIARAPLSRTNFIKGTASNLLPLPPLERGIRNFPVASPLYSSERFQRSDAVATLFFRPAQRKLCGAVLVCVCGTITNRNRSSLPIVRNWLCFNRSSSMAISSSIRPSFWRRWPASPPSRFAASAVATARA